MATRSGWVWHERYTWHDARGLLDSLGREAVFEPEPSLESGNTKRRLRNLIDASGLLDELIAIAPRAASDEELRSVHACEYVNRVRADSSDRGGDAGGWSPFGRWTYEIAALAAGGGRRCGARRDGHQRVRAGAPTRPPRRTGGWLRLLHFLERGLGRSAPSTRPRPGARGDHRLGRTSWQRHPGHVLD
jgi:hypothetical protein